MVRITPNAIFLLGAGASGDAGLPLATTMTNQMISDVTASGNETLSSALSYVIGGIHFLRGCIGQYPPYSVGVEELAETLELLRDRRNHKLSPFVGAWSEKLHLLDTPNPNDDPIGPGLSLHNS